MIHAVQLIITYIIYYVYYIDYVLCSHFVLLYASLLLLLDTGCSQSVYTVSGTNQYCIVFRKVSFYKYYKSIWSIGRVFILLSDSSLVIAKVNTGNSMQTFFFTCLWIVQYTVILVGPIMGGTCCGINWL